MKNQFAICVFLSFLAAFVYATPESEKFSFDGLSAKHPVSIRLERVEYRPRGMDLYLKVTNNSNASIDFSRANFTISSGTDMGYIKQSDFDGMMIHPNSKRFARIAFEFDKKSGFHLTERKQGTSKIEIDNIISSGNRKLGKIALSNI